MNNFETNYEWLKSEYLREGFKHRIIIEEGLITIQTDPQFFIKRGIFEKQGHYNKYFEDFYNDSILGTMAKGETDTSRVWEYEYFINYCEFIHPKVPMTRREVLQRLKPIIDSLNKGNHFPLSEIKGIFCGLWDNGVDNKGRYWPIYLDFESEKDYMSLMQFIKDTKTKMGIVKLI